MPGPAAILRELHRLRRHIKELELRGEQAPRAVKAHQNRVALQEQAVVQAQDALKQVKMHIHEKEVSIKATQQQIEKYKKQRDDVKSRKEYDTLNVEITHSEAHIRKIEDEILELMALGETKAAEIPQAEQALAKVKADLARAEQDQQDVLKRHGEEKARAQEELRAIEATLSEDVRAIYQRLINAKGVDALSGVRVKTCSSCYTEITPQMSSELQREQFVICKNCGRMLYLETV